MTILLSFPVAAGSNRDFKEQLVLLSNDDGFAWLREIVQHSLDEYVLNKLPRTDLQAYAPWALEENLEECGRLLNNTLDLRSEVLSLETRAIQAALDLQLSIQTAAFDTEIGVLSVNAAYAQSGKAEPGGPSAVEKRADVLSSARLTQLTLHNQPGVAVNYGQRVAFLRSLYVDNIRIAYERLYAIWLGHGSAFGRDLGPPPVWSGEFDSLSKLVKWMRNAAYQTTRAFAFERRMDVLISARSKFYQGQEKGYIEFTRKLWTDADVEYEFEITPEDLGTEKQDRVRLIGLGIGIGFHPYEPQLYDKFSSSAEERGKQSYIRDGLTAIQRSVGAKFSVGFPSQHSGLHGVPGADKEWDIPPITLSGVGCLIGGPPQENLRFVQERQFVNSQLLGKWKIGIDRMVQTDGEWAPRSAIALGLPVPDDLKYHLLPQDIVLGLRLAVTRG